MSEDLALLLTDVVDSTQTNIRWGDAVMARVWAAHDRAARDLMRTWHGREMGRSDGFLVLFSAVQDAVAFAQAYHASLALLEPPLQARVGVHVGPVNLRENSAADLAQGAAPFEIDGAALPVTARVMSIANGRQTLLSGAALLALRSTPLRTQSHGHWRLKGLPEPIEIFEVGEAQAPFVPPPDSAKAYRVVRTGDVWLPVREVPHNLPAERDAFVGRHESLLALAKYFDDGVRLVTLLGIGGIGKTRLSLRHARAWLGDYPGGAWFCDLSAARSSDGIVHAVAQGLSVRLGKAEPIEQLGAAIASRGRCLIILDNFEQVARHAEETLGAWLERAPEARFIATSREVLGILGEQALVLAPLSNAEAVRMFHQRVRAAGIRGPFSADDDAAVAPLVDLLDRLPLAVELASARVRVMPPRVLLQRMGERFRVLASQGGRNDRQATLRAALDWSWDLLSPVEQSALAQLSAFEGGFTLEAAKAVLDVAAFRDPPWAADLLQALVEKSLVRSDHAGRFDMLRTVQDYTEERLAAMPGGAQAAAWRRHAMYFASLDEQQATAGRCIEAENLVSACRRMAGEEPSLAAATLVNSWYALQLTGPFRAALELAQQLRPAATASVDLRMAVDRVLGGALGLLGQADAARERYLACLNAAETAGKRNLQAQMLSRIAELDMASGELDDARAALDKALALALESADPAAQYTALNGLGKLHLVLAQWPAAHRRYEDALALAQAVGDRRWQGGLHGNLGVIERLLGRPDDALSHFTSAAAMARELGDRQWEGNARCNLGLLLQETGDLTAARAQLDAALVLARQIGHRRLEATTLCNLGLVTEAQRDLDAALAFHTAAVATAHEIGDTQLEGQFCGYQGLLHAHRGRATEAHAALDRGETLLASAAGPASLGLLLCQRASAAALLGDRPAALASLQRAERLLGPLAPAADSELGLALKLARQRATEGAA